MFNLKKLKEKQFWKNVSYTMWQFIVVLAYAKFYLLCLTTLGLVLIIAIFVLETHGADVSLLSASVKPAMFSGISFVIIILLDKIFGENRFRK